MVSAHSPKPEAASSGPAIGRLSVSALPSRRSRFRSLSLATVAAGLLTLGAGFLWFVTGVPMQEARLSGKADGIVALTGGAYRISDAIELLASGHGTRLLISGANRATTLTEISRLKPEFGHWVRCC